MSIKHVEPHEVPKPYRKTDYEALANDYNLLQVGRALTIPKVSNIAHLKSALKLRGLSEPRDYEARQRGTLCYITKRSDKRMIHTR